MFKKYYDKVLVGIFAIVWFGIGIYFLSTMPSKAVVVYDCQMSEISPDFPIEVKEQCRKLRAQSGRI